jgi:hypothetical protein
MEPNQTTVEIRKPTTSKGKGFVRPNCLTTFWLNCPVCCKRYFKYDTHTECFARWCELCQDSFTTPQELATHAQQYHSKNFCLDCNHVYTNLKGHRTSEHAENSNAPRKRNTKMPKNKIDTEENAV